MIALKGAVIIPAGIIKDGVVVVDGRKIAYAGRVGSGFKPDPTRINIIDCRGKFICPGFIDVHVQGAGGCDILDGTYEAINTISKTLAKNGTTAFLATTVVRVHSPKSIVRSQKHLKAVAEAVNRGTDGAEVLGTHLEGPFINPKKCGMIKKENIYEVKRKKEKGKINEIIDACRDSLKMMTIAPELPGAIDIIKQLKKNKIVASIGHTDATYEEAVKGFDAGITHTTHMFNAMRGLHHREPGAAGAVLTDDRISVQLIADGRHLHPAVVKLVVKQKGAERIALITDSMSAAGLPDGRYVYNDLKYESKGGLAFYSDGRGEQCSPPTFIGTALTLNKIVKRIVDMGIVDLKDAVRMASQTPAEVLGIEGKKGSIEVGKDADIIVMDKNCDVMMTIINGCVFASERSERSNLLGARRLLRLPSAASQ